MIQKQFIKLLYIAGASFTFIGAATQLFDWTLAPYIFSIGAAILIYFPLKLVLEMRNADVYKRRQARSGLFAGLLLGLAAYFMFTHSNLWVIAILIYALTTLFLSFRSVEK